MPIFHHNDKVALSPEPSGEPSELDVPDALRRAAVIVLGAISGAVGALVVAGATWAVERLR